MRSAPITYVRHAMAVLDEAIHPTEWQLDDAGRAAAAKLADRLESPERLGALASSTEPKALATAQAIAERWDLDVIADDRLREARRPWIGPGYRAMAHAYLRGEPHDGWEPQTDVAARVAAAVDDASSRAGSAGVVIVTHGLALSTHLRARLGPEFDAESFWRGLGFPDAWVLDPSDLLHRLVPHGARS